MAKISKMRLNGIENPIGYDTNSLSFSWVVEGTESKSQKSARVVISTDPACDVNKKDHLIHDSGDSAEVNSIDYNPKLDTKTVLKPRTRYYWKVTVTTEKNEKIESPISFFETSKLNEPWTAKWISTEKVGKTEPPYVRKNFVIPNSKKVKEARVYSTGFGLYELYINGKKPTDEYFLPFNTNYKLWVQYQTFDVTKLLQPDKNTIGVLIGDGWARGRVGFDQPSADFSRKTDYRGIPVDYATDRYELLLELHLTYEDGSSEVINSDKTWKCHKSHILCNNIYDGEIQDANLIIKNWNLNDCDEKDWLECVEVNEPLHEKLTSRFSLPVVVKERLKPKEIIKTPAGETVIDMGQNMTGWIEMKIHAPKGFEIIVEHGEILQEENFFRDNIRSALEQFRYISDGNIQFVNQIHNCYIQFALEVEHPKHMPSILEKMKNAISGLYIKSDGSKFYDNRKDPESVTVHRIPTKLKTLSDCCDWVYSTYTPNIESSLASIAADDHRIVVNSNHSITDGGYFVNLLKNIQDPSKSGLFEKKAPIPRDLRTDLLKDEFDEFLQNKEKYMKRLPSYKQKDLTYLHLQEKVNLPDSYNLFQKRCCAHIKCSDLSPHIYSRDTNKLSHMSEFLWTGLCMAINAKNGKYGPIGLENCMDLRRLVPKERISNSFGNAYTDFTMSVSGANPKMTIGEINASFRSSFNQLKQNYWFYKEYLFPFTYMRDNCSVSHVSNVGPMKVSSPCKDFYLQCSQKEEMLRSVLQVTSYSKMNDKKDMNDLVLHMRYSPAMISMKNANDIFDTYVYFLKNVDPRMKSGDVLDELIHFQKSLE